MNGEYDSAEMWLLEILSHDKMIGTLQISIGADNPFDKDGCIWVSAYSTDHLNFTNLKCWDDRAPDSKIQACPSIF